MKQVRIVRLTRKGDAVRGILLVDDTIVCATLEDLWHENKQFISCIPAGAYTLKKVVSGKVGLTYTVIGCQPERDLIRVHGAATSDDVQGCIGVGMRWIKIGGRPGLDSQPQARKKFMEALGGDDEAKLIIAECYEGD